MERCFKIIHVGFVSNFQLLDKKNKAKDSYHDLRDAFLVQVAALCWCPALSSLDATGAGWLVTGD